MFTSFSTALSALSAHATAIDVIGNNLANINTTGFKESTVSFHDLVTQSLGAGLGETQVGFGVGSPVTLRHFSRGAIQSSSGPLDAAIQGDGFFVVKAGGGATQYTRGGNFQVDTNGNLTTATGEKLQGWTVGVSGALDTNAPVGDISVPVGALKPPIATTNFSADLNLNAAAKAGPPPDTFSTSLQVYDSLGNAHVVSATFTKTTTANQWQYSLNFPSADLSAPFTPVTGTLTFDGAGKLIGPTPSDAAPAMSVTGLADGASDMDLTWNLFNGQAPRITQFSQTSAT